jgi:hypothetical protein
MGLRENFESEETAEVEEEAETLRLHPPNEIFESNIF